MSLISFKRGQGSIVLRVKILNSSVATGAGLPSLTSASSGLIISTIADNEATATTYTVAGSTIESITTLGTFAAPTATKCRFKEVDATNHKGVYEIQIADARFAVSSAKSLLVSISGATNAAETDCVIPLTDMDPYDAVRGGMSAFTSLQSDTDDIQARIPAALVSGRMDASVGAYQSGQAPLQPATAGRTLVVDAAGLADANAVKVGPTGSGTAQTAGDLKASIASVQSDTDDIQTRIPAALTANGNMKSSVMEFLATALTETSGQIAAAFKQFFNIASPTSTMNRITLVDTATTATTATNVTNAPTAGDFTAAMKTSLNAATPVATLSPAYDAAKTAADATTVAASFTSLLAKLLKYVQLILRKDSAIATDNATELTAINANGGSGGGGYANTTDAQEALRDRGDAAYITATGFAVPGSPMALVSDALDATAVAASGATEIANAVLTAAASAPIAANAKKVNDTTLTGNGSSIPWGPA